MSIGKLKALVEKVQGVDLAVGMVRQPISISTSNENKSFFLAAYPEGTTIRNYHFKEGSLQPGKVVLGSITAKKLNLSLNDELSITTIGSNGYVNSSFVVSATLNEFVEMEILRITKDIIQNL